MNFLEIFGGIVTAAGALGAFAPDKLPLQFPTWIAWATLAFGILMIVGGVRKSYEGSVEPAHASTESSQRTGDISLINSTNTGLINSGTLNVNSRFKITESIATDVAATLIRSEPVVFASANTGGSKVALQQLKKFILEKGFEYGGEMEVGYISFLQPTSPVTLFPKVIGQGGISIGGGGQTLYVDMSIEPTGNA